MKKRVFRILCIAAAFVATMVTLSGCRGGRMDLAPPEGDGSGGLFAPAVAAAPANWVIRAVDTSGNVGGPTAISLIGLPPGTPCDPKCDTFISYYDQSHKDLWLAHAPSYLSAYSLTPLDADADGDGRFNSFIWNSQTDQPEVYYYQDFGGVMRKQGTDPQEYVVDDTHDMGAGVLAILAGVAVPKFIDVVYV
ncbi:MAG: hypothetical protein ACREJQ_08270, partial [bacterium]